MGVQDEGQGMDLRDSQVWSATLENGLDPCQVLLVTEMVL